MFEVRALAERIRGLSARRFELHRGLQQACLADQARLELVARQLHLFLIQVQVPGQDSILLIERPQIEKIPGKVRQKRQADPLPVIFGSARLCAGRLVGTAHPAPDIRLIA